MVLMPRLISMNLDSKDARVYFGLQNKTSCSKCRRRKGRSALRQATRQSGEAVRTLYAIVKYCTDDVLVRLSKEKLLRWGFNPLRGCILRHVCNHLLIVRPGHMDEVFPGLDFRDRMHGLFIFLHRQVCTALIDMKLPKQTRTNGNRAPALHT